MSEGASSIDAIVCTARPPWKRWTSKHRIPEETVKAARELGDEKLVSALERIANSDGSGAVLGAVWTVSCPGLPWTETLATTLARAQLDCKEDDFGIVQSALRQIEFDRPDLALKTLRTFFLDDSKRPGNAIVLLFVFLKTGQQNSALLIQCLKRSSVRRRGKSLRRNSHVSVDGLLFGALLADTEVSMAGLRDLAADALVELDDSPWRAVADAEQLIHLCRDLIALLCLIGDEEFFEVGSRRIVHWLEELAPHEKTALVFGRVITLLEEGLGLWYPWFYGSCRSLLESIRDASWASGWFRDLEKRLRQVPERGLGVGSPSSAEPVWRTWMKSAKGTSTITT